MTSTQNPAAPQGSDHKESWVPMIAIALGQSIMSFNVASLPVAMGGMVRSFGVPPTTVATGIVMYSLAVAGFVMLGAKLVQRFGATRVFRAVVALFGVAQVLMVLSPSAQLMLSAQLGAGLAAAVIVPALVALIANHYRGQQQAAAVGALGSARAAAGVLAFLIGGFLGGMGAEGWRGAFGILIAVSAVVFLLSFKLKPDPGRREVGIDIPGVILAAASIILISFGFNNLNRWGLLNARPNAPFDIFGISPAPVMIVVGVVLLQVFIAWSRRVQASGKTPLLDLRVITSGREKAAVMCMFAVVALEAMLNFSVPLYIQIVQGSTPWKTAIAMMPFNLTVFFTAMLVVKLYNRLTPRQIGRFGFILCTVALVYLSWVIRNNWSALPVMVGLIAFGIGQGALVTLVFNVLVTAAPKKLAGDVGSLRGTTQNLAAGVGTAIAGALLVGLLSGMVMVRLADNPVLTKDVQEQLNLDSINFVSDDRLREIMTNTTATQEQIAEAIRVNEEARTRALKIGLLLMAGVAFLAIMPAGRLPDYKPGEIPANPEPDDAQELTAAAAAAESKES